MKKQLIAVIGLAVISAPAFATKARMIALGENINDNIGSLYFSDSRNLFQNAAYINDYKNMIIMEWGSSGTKPATAPTDPAIKSDSDKYSQAEGGFTASAGKYAYGLYLGAESPYTNEIRSYTRSHSNEAFHQDNQIDAWFGGETTFKWGVNVTYSKSNDRALGASQNSASVRFGAIWEKLEAFANIAVANEAKMNSLVVAGKEHFKGHNGYEAGATYNLDVVKVFGYLRHASWAHEGMSPGATNATAYTGKFNGDYWLYQVGAGKEHKLTDRATLFAKLEYLNFSREVDPKSGAATKKVNLDDWKAPLTIGMEYDASSWLTLRGSVVQNIVGQTDNDYNGQEAAISAGVLGKRPSGKRTIANSTSVNAGMTLKFGNLSIDGVIGTTANDGTLAGEGPVGTAPKQKAGVLSLENLASRVAMTYRF